MELNGAGWSWMELDGASRQPASAVGGDDGRYMLLLLLLLRRRRGLRQLTAFRKIGDRRLLSGMTVR